MSPELKAKLDAVLGPAPQAPVRQLPSLKNRWGSTCEGAAHLFV
jgi:hypothetical protein